jgi:hypothetical protein
VVSRWTAVSVALAPEEAAISLEQEMQKAYSAFAAAETGHAGSTSAPQETHPAVGESSPIAVAAAEPVVAVPATPAPETVQALTEVANAATDAISAAVKELEAVAASYEQQMPQASVAQESAPAEKPAEAEAKSPETASATVEASPVATEETAPPKLEEAQPKVAEMVKEETQAEAPDGTAPTPVEELRAGESSAAHISGVAAPVDGAPVDGQPSSAASADMMNGESDAAESTAAASEEPAPKVADEVSAPEDAAARAVAAGAEKTPEEASPQSDSDEGIASIVDSVLAEMRPKIYEEISRKMGRKKK